MIERMSNIFEEIHKNPSQEKIENGRALAKNKNITKELITANFKSDEGEYRWECDVYEKKVYGEIYYEDKVNYRKELIKQRLWRIPAWRLLIRIYHKLRDIRNKIKSKKY